MAKRCIECGGAVKRVRKAWPEGWTVWRCGRCGCEWVYPIGAEEDEDAEPGEKAEIWRFGPDGAFGSTTVAMRPAEEGNPI